MNDAIPFIVLGAYLLFLLVLGLLGWRRSVATEEDYYLAGRTQGWIVSSLTIMATFFSSWALLGAPGKVYTEGLVFALFALNVPLSGSLIVIFGRGISKAGRREGFVTPGDMVAAHYGGHAMRLLVALTSILYVVPYVVMQFKAGGVLCAALVEKPVVSWADNFSLGAVVLAAVTTTYIMIGGMRSVAWTDVFQGVLLVVGMLMGGWVVIESLGGLGEFTRRVSELPSVLLTAPGVSGEWAPLFLFTVCTLGAAGSMVSPAQWMRYYAADSTRTLKRSAIIFAVVLTSCFLLGVMLVGIGAQVLYPSTIDAAGQLVLHPAVGDKDEILILVLKDKLPQVMPVVGAWIASFLVVAIAAGSMSTADSNLHALGAVLTRDIYDRYLRSDASARERTWIGRAVILVATTLSLAIVLGARGGDTGFLQSSLEMIVDIGVLAVSFAAQLLPTTIDMLFLRRGTRLGASVGLASGLVCTALAWYTQPFQGASIGPIEIRMMPGAWGILVNVALFAFLSALGRSASSVDARTLSPPE